MQKIDEKEYHMSQINNRSYSTAGTVNNQHCMKNQKMI